MAIAMILSDQSYGLPHKIPDSPRDAVLAAVGAIDADMKKMVRASDACG
jgi:hypothetical protein